MAKPKKKSAKEASTTFHNIMAASVKGNPKPKKEAVDISKLMQMLKHIQEEISMVVPNYGEYAVLQVSPIGAGQLFYNINGSCPIEKSQKIEKVILENAALLDLKVVTEIE